MKEQGPSTTQSIQASLNPISCLKIETRTASFDNPY
jgi:hypothetical protein